MAYLILKINLSDRSYAFEEIPADIIRKYIGGRGLGSYLIYEAVPPNADPLGEENHLIFTAGPANGTPLFYSSKINVNTKSPLTNLYLYSIASGTLAHQMKKADLWAIDIFGIAETPIYLSIEGHIVHFKNADALWGMEPAGAQQRMLQDLSEKETATVAIGPAGENRVLYAAIFGQGPLYRCFGRGGAGCVMGSKNLKGLVFNGGESVEPDYRSIKGVNRQITNLLKTQRSGWAEKWRRYETAADLSVMNDLGALPARNWQNGQFEGWQGIDKSTTPLGWPEKGRSCAPFCPTPGCREVEIKAGPYQGARSDIEWETIYALGSNCGIDKMDAIIAAGQICDEYGIDTMTAGLTIGFAMECFEKGLIDSRDTDGIELRFGSDKAMIAALRKIVQQTGFGNRLAKGTQRLAQEIEGSENFAMHAKGLELGGYECRGLNGQALQNAIDNRGGCHHGYGLLARTELFDDTRLEIAGKGEQVRLAAISRIVRDSMIVCTFTPVFSNSLIADALSALFEESWHTDDLMEVGMRVMCHERLFNMREGITREDDTLPKRLLKEAKPDGPTAGAVVPLEELKDDFYKAMGFDMATGNPTDALLAELGIKR